MSRWGELIPHREDDPSCLCGCLDDPLVQCWHFEPGTPCDWDVCRQPERRAAGDYGTDPARGVPVPYPASEHCRPGRCMGLMCCSYECSQGRCPSPPKETTP